MLEYTLGKGLLADLGVPETFFPIYYEKVTPAE